MRVDSIFHADGHFPPSPIAVVEVQGYVFAALIYWVFCFSMSRYSIFMERRLNTGHKR